MSTGRSACIRASVLAAWLVGVGPLAAQSPEAEPEPYAPVNRRIESSDLSPVQLPSDLWRGLDAAAIEKWLSTQDLPPRSPALAEIWRRLVASAATAPGGDELLRLRLDALYRTGLLGEIGEVLAKGGGQTPAAQLWQARIDIGLGAREKGCQALAGPQQSKALRAEKQLLLGYCAAVAGDTGAAALAASLAREEGSHAELALSILEGLEGGVARKPVMPARVSLLDYRFLELTGPIDGDQVLGKAEPALLVALATSAALPAKVQIAAAETALRLNIMPPAAVAEAYRRVGGGAKGPATSDPGLKRAQLFRSLEETQTPATRASLMRALLEEARRAGVANQTARMLTPLISNLWPAADNSQMAESIVQIALAGGELDLARRWAESVASLQHWLALVDLADPQAQRVSPSGLGSLDELAKRGRLAPQALHRVVTVLDALRIDVPLRLWESAGRVGQPAGGYLPPTGVLAELAKASEQKETGRTIILVFQALGPDGPEGANVLALGDTLRALKRAGLEADARRVAVEALLAAWPRTIGG